MVKADRISNDTLLQTGLELMKQNGTPLTKAPGKGRSMLYNMHNSESVRVRTCNDHLLIVLAKDPTDYARLNIEGTDWLLIVFPEVERTHGNVISYLIPTKVVVAEARKSHREWLESNPNTKGANKTKNLWFDNTNHKSSGYAKKWEEYKLKGEASTYDAPNEVSLPTTNIKTEVEAARRRLAKVAGILPEGIKISIDFSV